MYVALTTPSFNELLGMDETMMPGVVERMIEKNSAMKKTLGPLMSLASFFK